MALIYDLAPNGFFIQVGSIVVVFNEQRIDANALDTSATDILDTFEAMTNDTPALMTEGFATAVRSWQDQHIARRATLAGLASTRLTEKETILDEIGETTGQIAAVLSRLIFQMNDDAETINATTVTLGTPVNNASNTGNGELLITKILDGVTSPGSGAGGTFASHPEYRGLDSEFGLSETLQFGILSDSFGGGVTEGGETIQWDGLASDVQYGWQSEGSGAIGTINAIHSSSLNQLQNPDVELWVDNVPTSWEIVGTGIAGTHIIQETTAVNVYHGTSSINFLGDGAKTLIELKQQLNVAGLTGSRGFVLTCRLKGDASITTGDIVIRLEGTGYTASSSEEITIAAASIPTAFTLEHFFIILPQVIPSDLSLVVRWENTPESAKNIFIDDFAFSPIAYGGGVGVAVVRGSIPWVVGDRISVVNTTDSAGVFQKFFRESYGVQLPSNNAGTETILDSLAQ